MPAASVEQFTVITFPASEQVVGAVGEDQPLRFGAAIIVTVAVPSIPALGLVAATE